MFTSFLKKNNRAKLWIIEKLAGLDLQWSIIIVASGRLTEGEGSLQLTSSSIR